MMDSDSPSDNLIGEVKIGVLDEHRNSGDQSLKLAENNTSSSKISLADNYYLHVGLAKGSIKKSVTLFKGKSEIGSVNIDIEWIPQNPNETDGIQVNR